MRQLAGFDIVVRENDFLLSIKDDTGQVTELTASAEQVDLLIDALNDLLGDEDEGD
jgi:hypothetical protein